MKSQVLCDEFASCAYTGFSAHANDRNQMRRSGRQEHLYSNLASAGADPSFSNLRATLQIIIGNQVIKCKEKYIY